MEHNNKLELFWTGIPAVILAGLILYGLTTWTDIMFPEKTEEPIVVELYAKQFGWTARYAGGDNTLGFANVRLIEGVNVLGVDPSDNNSSDDIIASELRLPKGRPVLLKFRSQDVIHSAYLPHCGAAHYNMQMKVVVESEEDFNKWLKEQQTFAEML